MSLADTEKRDGLFANESDMAVRVKALDWEQTPMGSMNAWPPSLRVAASICLSSRFPMSIWWGPSFTLLYNDAYAPIFGKRHPDALGRSARDVWAEVWPQIGPQVEAVMREGVPTWNECTLVPMERNGFPEDAWFTWSFSPIFDEAGEIGGVFLAAVEETARLLTERDRLMEQHQLALDAANMGWWHYDPITQVSTWDDRYKKIFGVQGHQCPNEEILARLHPEDLPGVWAEVEKALDPTSSRPFVSEYRIRLEDDSIRWIEAHGIATFEGDGGERRAVSFVGTVADVTERKEVEAVLRESEERLRTLNARLNRSMTETHHRVKNNLQMVSALMEMQQPDENGMIHASELIRLQQNVQALGVIHDILTQEAKEDGDGAVLSIKSVLEQFLPILQETLGARRLVTAIDEISLPGKQVTALTVVANELVSNAMKHGKGNIEFTLRAVGNTARLEVCDDGPGFVEGFDHELAAHTGLELIESIARYDLRGEVAYETREQGGARIVIVFPTECSVSL